MNHIKNDKGLTLVELLAVISLSMIVMISAYQCFYFITNSIDQSSLRTELRKEANLAVLNIENNLLNVDSVDLDDNQSSEGFKHFTGVMRKLGKMDRETSSFTYTEEKVEVSIEESNLIIDGATCNANDMDYSDTTFSLSGNNLKLNLQIAKVGTDETYSLSKIFSLGNE